MRSEWCAGAGTFEAAHVTLTQGLWIGADVQAPERLFEQLVLVCDRAGDTVPCSGAEQGGNEVRKAFAARSPH